MTQPPDPDSLDWDRDVHGAMADHATDDEPQTETYEADSEGGDPDGAE